MNRFLKYWDSPGQFVGEVLAVASIFAWIPLLAWLLPLVMDWGV